MIERYFEKYGDAIISFNYVAKVKTIHFWLNDKWQVPKNLIPPTLGIKHNKTEVDKKNSHRYYCILHTMVAEPIGDNEMVEYKPPTYDEMFEVLSTVFEHNIEIEKKEALLKEKINELQQKFKELSLEDLEKMDFKTE